MKFGLHLALQPAEQAQDTEVLRDALQIAGEADDLGFHSIWCSENSFLESGSISSAPEVFMAALSQRTRTARLGLAVQMQPSINHPARVAARLATLDLMSHGRLDWAVGVPLGADELRGFDIAPRPTGRRGWEIPTRECAKMLWQEPYLGVKTETFSMEARNLVPKPVQTPHPPLWRVCLSLEDIRDAGHAGMGAFIQAMLTPEDVGVWADAYYAAMREHCTPLGRGVTAQVALLSPLLMTTDPEIAEVSGRETVWAWSNQTPKGPSGLCGGGPDFSEAAAFERLRDQLAAYESFGVDQSVFLGASGPVAGGALTSTLRRLADQMMPQFLRRDDARAPAPWLAAITAPPSTSYQKEGTEAAIPMIEAYPLLSERLGVDASKLQQDRSPLSAAVWRLQVGGPRAKKKG